MQGSNAANIPTGCGFASKIKWNSVAHSWNMYFLCLFFHCILLIVHIGMKMKEGQMSFHK